MGPCTHSSGHEDLNGSYLLQQAPWLPFFTRNISSSVILITASVWPRWTVHHNRGPLNIDYSDTLMSLSIAQTLGVVAMEALVTSCGSS